ncbi:MAG: M48 family metallopeptidase [Chitinophagaceae bacterium]
MKKIFLLIAASASFLSCSTNKITGTKQLLLVSEGEMQAMSLTEYQKVISTSKVLSPTNNKNAAMVQRVSNRLINAITTYYNQNNLGQELAGYKWEVNLIDENTVNAWCMPGGKIVVYTGILPVTQNETALAIVMGHEITHALAKHGAARMSQGLLQQFGGAALAVAIQNKPAETQNLYNTAFGIGTNVGFILPFSRSNETEADKFGLRYAALAGYDPREAVAFWQRMSQLSGGQKPPAFLSTHPADEKRIADLQNIMDETLKNYYKPVK